MRMEDKIMHEQLHTSAADLQRMQDKIRRLTPDHKALFTAYLAEISKSPDILPLACAVPAQAR